MRLRPMIFCSKVFSNVLLIVVTTCSVLMACNTKKLEQLEVEKPHEQLNDAPPEVRNYILALEKQLANTLPFESYYNVVNQKYLDLQEELFMLQVQIGDYKQKIQELTAENDKLMKSNGSMNKEAAKCNEIPFHTAGNNSIKREERRQSTDQNENNANSILVKGAPPKLFEVCRKEGIIFIGQKMDLKLTESDIRKITSKERKFYERQNMQPDKLIFIVELSNSDTKVNILKNKEKLKIHPDTKDIEVTDYVSENTYNLYQYAKVLKTCGYDLVYWRNNSVYAKKTRSSNSQPILIDSANQVDVLKQIK